MKIDSTHQNHPAAPVGALKKTAARPANESRQSQDSGSAFSVSLSVQAQQVAAGNKVGEAVSQSRIADIREQLASSTYNISGRDVAAKILSLLKG